MPVSEQTPVNSYTGNGVTTVFPYTFKLLAQADIEVTVDGVVKTLTTDYTVSGVGVDGGGNVTFVTAPANGTTVVLHRAMAYKRDIDYQENGDLPAATLDEDVDRVVMMAQQLDEANDRALALAIGTTGVDTELPAPEAGKAIGWNATEDGLTNFSALPTSSVAVSSFMETVLVASDADNAAALLDVPQNVDIAVPIIGGLDNVGLSVTMAANAVTIALKGADGNDPSVSNPVRITFPGTSETDGKSYTREVTSALSLTIPSGATLGTVDAVNSRVWVTAVDNDGAVVLSVSQRVASTGKNNVTQVVPFIGNTQSTQTISAGSDTAAAYYAASTLSSKAFAVLGAFDSTQATAGTWASSATSIKVNPKHRPGDVVGVRIDFDGSVATGTATIPDDDTIPQITEGDQVLTTYGAQNGPGVSIVECQVSYANSASIVETLALFDGNNDAIAAVQGKAQAAGTQHTLFCSRAVHVQGGGTIYSARIGGASAGTTTFNGVAGARKMGGALASYLKITEIYV